MEKLKFQNSQGVEVMTMLYTKQALAKLEEMSNKFTRNDPKAATKKVSRIYELIKKMR